MFLFLHPMPRYFVKLAYDGQAYHGWQRQKNAMSVQQVIEDSLSTILRTPSYVIGCGRTDTGVHAKEYYLHVDLEAGLDLETVRFRWNQNLPPDIAIHDIIPVHEKAHARFDATAREYRYFIHRKKDAFSHGRSYLLRKNLDQEAMQEAAQELIGKKDFEAFARTHSDQKTSICDLKKASWTFLEDEWVFTIVADRFLRNMVRAIVGTLVEVGEHKLDLDAFREVILSKDRSKAGTSAPAQGLYLYRIDYPYLQHHGE